MPVNAGEPGCIYLDPDSHTGTSKAVVTESTSVVYTTQTLPIDRAGKIPRGIPAQTELVLSNLALPPECDRSTIVKLNVYITEANDADAVYAVLARRFRGTKKPAATFVVTALPDPEALVAMDAVAVPRNPERIRTEKGIRSGTPEGEIGLWAGPTAGPLFYVSGMADTNSLAEATRITLNKLMSAISQLGLNRSDILQLKAFFQPMSEVAVVRKAMADFFRGPTPPTVFVEWISPKPNPPIEIELVAAGKPSGPNDNDSVVFLTPPGTTSTKVFSRVAKVNHGRLVFISGLYGLNAHDPEAEVRDIFESLGNVLQNTGSDFEHLVKATYYVSDDIAGNKLNEIRPKFFNASRPPAASKAKVRGVGAADKTVGIDMIGVTK